MNKRILPNTLERAMKSKQINSIVDKNEMMNQNIIESGVEILETSSISVIN